jgi:hypothetical protein
MFVVVTGEEFLREINQVNSEIVKSLNAEFTRNCAKRGNRGCGEVSLYSIKPFERQIQLICGI